MERAGVRSEVDLHGLRLMMIAELLAGGVDPRTVMGRAGHSSEATTMAIYAKVRPAVDSAAAEMWGRLLQEKLASSAHCRVVITIGTVRRQCGIGCVWPLECR
jgi:hypothetical protein